MGRKRYEMFGSTWENGLVMGKQDIELTTTMGQKDGLFEGSQEGAL